MGRSSAEQAARNRRRIVAQASRLFRERGVENVSINDVMAAAGLTVGGFYKHFASKDALVQEACALSFEQALQSWLAVGGQEEGGDARALETLVRHYFRARSADRRCPILAYAPDMPSPGTSSATRQTYDRGIEALFGVFAGDAGAGGSEDGPQGTVDEAAVLFAAMVGAQFLREATRGSAWSLSLLDAVTERAQRA